MQSKPACCPSDQIKCYAFGVFAEQGTLLTECSQTIEKDLTGLNLKSVKPSIPGLLLAVTEPICKNEDMVVDADQSL